MKVIIVRTVSKFASVAFLLMITVGFVHAQSVDSVAGTQTGPAAGQSDTKATLTKGSEDDSQLDVPELKTDGSDVKAKFSYRSAFQRASENPVSFKKGDQGLPFAKQDPAASRWQFSFTPYLYATGIEGRVGARGRVVDIDESFGDVLSNLNLGLMGTFEARKGKLIFLSDLIWTKMSVERDTPGDLYSDAKIGVNLFIFDPEVGYRVAESRAGSFDVLGGVRIWSVENNLNFRTGILPGFDVSERKTFAAPVVGVHGVLNLSPKFYLSGKFDIGGFGVGPDLTTQFYGGGGYRVKPNIALVGGYRYLMVDYDDSQGFLYDTTMNGFVFGAKFSF